jgi:DNA-binding NtrC family response regulator
VSDQHTILIVDDEDLICFVLTQLLRVHGYAVQTASRGEEALEMIASSRPDLVILDIRMPGLSGFDVLNRIRSTDPALPVILMTALSSVRDAVEGIKAGAFDYMGKPFDNNEMIATIRRALARAEEAASSAEGASDSAGEEDEVEELHPQLATLATGERTLQLARAAQRIARKGTPAILHGELGSGKRRLARLIHEVSGREGPFIAVECTGATESVLRSELYGAGSATGPGRTGKLELLRQGTLLFDEITDMPAALQDTLAKDFARSAFTHPATGATLPLRGALLCATSCSAEQMHEALTPALQHLVEGGQLHLPPLRARRDDIPALVRHFMREAAEEFKRPVRGVSPAAMELLCTGDWPGNVHQLKAAVRRAVLTAAQRIDIDDVTNPTLRNMPPAEDFPPVTVTRSPLKEQVRRHVAEIERGMLVETLGRTGWNKAKASRILGITYKTMLKKVAEYGLENGKKRA